ncbi:MAG: hypothetical protein LBB53_05570 [Prevotellaceae bacterium]|jgi:hypothetical protein|nr:hypothetical protein [Prevotellaceae bacterium]
MPALCYRSYRDGTLNAGVSGFYRSSMSGSSYSAYYMPFYNSSYNAGGYNARCIAGFKKKLINLETGNRELGKKINSLFYIFF